MERLLYWLPSYTVVMLPTRITATTCISLIMFFTRDLASRLTDGTLTHATALVKLIGESVPIPESMFSSVEKETITNNLVDYSDEIDRDTMKEIYKHAVQLNKLKFSKLRKLKILLCDAKAAVLREPRESEEMLVEVPQVFSSKRSCQKEAECDRQNKSLKVNDGDGDVVQSDAIMDEKTN